MSRASGADGPEDVDATFERIVADLRAEGLGTDTDELERDLADDFDDDTADTDDFDDGRGGDPDRSGHGDRADGDRREPSRRRRGRPTSGATDGTGAGSGWRTAGTDWDETLFGDDPADDEHFVPPEPPPLPRPKKGAFVVLLFFVIGIVLMSAPGVIGLTSSIGLPLGLLALATGIALLLLRVRQGPPDGADPTNGAQV